MNKVLVAIMLMYCANVGAVDLEVGIGYALDPIYPQAISTISAPRYDFEETQWIGNITVSGMYKVNDLGSIKVYAQHISLLLEDEPNGYGINIVGVSAVIHF